MNEGRRRRRSCHCPATSLSGMTPGEALRVLSEIQHGLVARRQARRLRFDDRATGRLVSSGEWAEETHRVLRRVGAPRTRDQEFSLAVLDGPRGSVTAAASAAELWGLPSFNGMRLEIAHPRDHMLRPPPIAIVRRPLILPAHHVTEVRGIAVTTLARTLFDIASRIHEDRLDVLIERGIARSPALLEALRAMLPELAQRGRPGIGVMRRQLAKRPAGYIPVASGLERRLDKLARAAGVPALRRQVDVGGHEWLGRVDFADEIPLLYEVDSILHHTSPGDVARDEARDRAMRAAGFREVVRIPEEDIWYHPDRAVARIQEARRRNLDVKPARNVRVLHPGSKSEGRAGA